MHTGCKIDAEIIKFGIISTNTFVIIIFVGGQGQTGGYFWGSLLPMPPPPHNSIQLELEYMKKSLNGHI